MYLSGKKRGFGDTYDPVSGTYVQDIVPSDVLASVTSPVSVSPLILAGLGLVAFAYFLSGAQKAGAASARKAKAIRKALRA